LDFSGLVVLIFMIWPQGSAHEPRFSKKLPKSLG
jgi:hypothetical protein